LSEPTTLTFDVDDVEELSDFCDFVRSILNKHGPHVWIRKSSSGEGFHLKVVEGTRFDTESGEVVFIEKKMDADDVVSIRSDTDGECRGRLKGDSARLRAGMNVGRLFRVKSNKVCGQWIPASVFLEKPTII
tara:strand:- start:726 stop:1121 length:396 start_codon:yes stop_codon:yes gene_type:complete